MDAHFMNVAVIFLALATPIVLAYDPSPLLDTCVAVNDSKSAVLMDGKICKDPKLVTADDFVFTGFNIPGNTSNNLGSKVSPVSVDQLPGINTLGVSIARLDFAPYGINPPHTHPRASELLVVTQGTLYVGFVTSNPENRLISKILNNGDVFVFPIGLVHFQYNVGNTEAIALATLNSQKPGVITIGNSIFGSKPPISDDVLDKAFQLNKKVVDYLQAQSWLSN